MGPILLCVNPYRDVGNPLTLSSTRSLALSSQLNRVVQEAVRQQSETGYPQAIILSGGHTCVVRGTEHQSGHNKIMSHVHVSGFKNNVCLG